MPSVKFSVLGIFELLNFWQNLSTVAYKSVADIKKNCVIHFSEMSQKYWILKRLSKKTIKVFMKEYVQWMD